MLDLREFTYCSGYPQENKCFNYFSDNNNIQLEVTFQPNECHNQKWKDDLQNEVKTCDTWKTLLFLFLFNGQKTIRFSHFPAKTLN